MNNDLINKINASGWHDWYFDSVQIGFDCITIKISDRDEIHFTCENPIGFSYKGHWDENVIEDINILTEHSVLSESIERVRKNNRDNLNLAGKNIDDRWYAFQILLIDGVKIVTVCNNLKVS